MIHFEETQAINRTFKIMLLILLILFLLLSTFVNKAFIIGILISFIFFIIFSSLKLTLTVFDDKIAYSLTPFHKSDRVILMSTIAGIDIIQPSCVGVFGFKIKNTMQGTYYFLGGASMVRIKIMNGKTIYFSTKHHTDWQTLQI
ncbi:MAG: hypothetical protein PWP51_752 [Clostridiales bacterium]|jgi:hypothetical protein|nr:hypothetical protein [Clostridiales bacterium]MDN5298199.1 hypothetical protein [Clostridiales bacterium]